MHSLELGSKSRERLGFMSHEQRRGGFECVARQRQAFGNVFYLASKMIGIFSDTTARTDAFMRDVRRNAIRPFSQNT